MAQHLDGDGRAGLGIVVAFAQRAHRILRTSHRRAGHAHDHVAGLEAGELLRLRRQHQGALAGAEIAAEVGVQRGEVQAPPRRHHAQHRHVAAGLLGGTSRLLGDARDVDVVAGAFGGGVRLLGDAPRVDVVELRLRGVQRRLHVQQQRPAVGFAALRLDAEGERLAVALDAQGDGFAGLERAEQALRRRAALALRAQRLAVDADDHVADGDAGAFRRAARRDGADARAPGVGGQHHAEHAAVGVGDVVERIGARRGFAEARGQLGHAPRQRAHFAAHLFEFAARRGRVGGAARGRRRGRRPGAAAGQRQRGCKEFRAHIGPL
uniref:Uncharacterized protein n=1 Tax=Mizugakiibacter sediminis TaxID=1475481 RepID=A0A0U1PBI0_9GAMM